MLQYFIVLMCLSTTGGCVTPAPDLAQDAVYADSCIAIPADKDGNITDAPNGQCSIDVPDGGMAVVSVKGDAPNYVITLFVQQNGNSSSRER